MAKKNQKAGESPKFVVKKREPKEKPNFFQNIPDIKSRLGKHPLAEVFEFPTEEKQTELPSTIFEDSRPQAENSAVHTSNNLAVHSNETLPSTKSESKRPQKLKTPSTNSQNSRPPFEELPSTKNNVDVLPSTDTELPSTKVGEKGEVDGKTSTPEKVAVHTSEKLPSTKGDRHNKFLARYDNRINPAIKQKIDVFCAKFDLSQREFAEQSAVHFIDVWTAKFEKNVDGKTAHDDRPKMIMWKSKPIVINLYRLYNAENKWKFKDDEVAAKYSEVDPRIIELGIIETLFNSNFKKINSFGYFQNEIDNFIEQKLGEEMLVFLIEHYRKKFLTATKRELDYSILQSN